MYRNAQRLNKLVNNILDIRRLDMGNLGVKTQKKDLVKMFARLSVDYKVLCAQKQITYAFETDVETLDAVVDSGKLELIVSNLISNAFKYTGNGGHVCLRLLSVADGHYRIEVRDTGIGISVEDLPHVFERYYRAERTSTTVGEGLGLAFVKQLAELCGGSVSVKSELGKGSVFAVEMPLKDTRGDDTTQPVDIEDVLDELWTEQGEKELSVEIVNPTALRSVLVIDDEHETVALIARCLGGSYRVLKAYDGLEGLGMVATHLPDLIICDIMMPHMNGFEFLSCVKEDRKLQHIPVIMFSAKQLDEDKIESFRYGADAYLTKPVSLKMLRARVEQFMKRNEATLYESMVHPLDVGSVAAVPDVSEVCAAKAAVSKEDEKFILQCKDLIDRYLLDERLGVDFLAGQMHMSHSALYKKVKAVTGKSAVDLIVDYRIFRAVEMFRNGETNVTSVAEKCGFNDIRSFRAAFKSRMGMPPKQFLQNL